MVVGRAFLTGLAITVDGAGFTGGTLSLTWRRTAEGQTADGWTSTTPALISLTATSFNQNLHIIYTITQTSFDDVCLLTLITER